MQMTSSMGPAGMYFPQGSASSNPNEAVAQKLADRLRRLTGTDNTFGAIGDMDQYMALMKLIRNNQEMRRASSGYAGMSGRERNLMKMQRAQERFDRNNPASAHSGRMVSDFYR